MPKSTTTERGRADIEIDEGEHQRRVLQIPIPTWGRPRRLGAPDGRDLLFLGGVSTMALLALIDPPVAIAIGAGYVLAKNGRNGK